MTLPPERIGDKGRRYEVCAFGYPNDGFNVIGWSDTFDGANGLADSIAKAPGCEETEVKDRLCDAAENAVIAYGMGWELDGVMDVLKKIVCPE